MPGLHRRGVDGHAPAQPAAEDGQPVSHGVTWLIRPQPRSSARLRLFCLAYAGGGASLFRSWPNGLPADVEVCGVQLPGRETRLFERPFMAMGPLVDDLVA